jgi:hypothetical protein
MLSVGSQDDAAEIMDVGIHATKVDFVDKNRRYRPKNKKVRSRVNQMERNRLFKTAIELEPKGSRPARKTKTI